MFSYQVFSGKEALIRLSWKQGKFILISSLDTISEIKKVLRDFKIKLPEDMVKEWIDLIIKNSMVVSPKEKVNIVKNDPKDNIFIEAAIAGNADYIVSQDKHLLEVKEIRDIKIITPEEFVREL